MRPSFHRYLYDSGRALVLDGNQDLTDADLVHLVDLDLELRHSIRTIALSHTNVSGQGVMHLAALPNLTAVYLHGTRIADDAPFERLPKSVETLNLDETAVADRSLTKLRRLPHLRVLRLRHTCVTDRSIFELLKISSLREVCLEGTAVSVFAKQRLDNNIFLETAGFSSTLRSLEHHVIAALHRLLLKLPSIRSKCPLYRCAYASRGDV